MDSQLMPVFREMERENIQYCVLRDGERLDQLEGEVDLLVAEAQFASVAAMLPRLGFVPLPSLGYAPHHFFINYDADADRWLKLDVVTQIALGRPFPVYETDLANKVLAHRGRWGNVYVPAPEWELIGLLLHCVLDKGRFEDRHRLRLQVLCSRVVDEPKMTHILQKYWLRAATWGDLAQQLVDGEWTRLLAAGALVKARLAKQARLRGLERRIRMRVQRKLSRLLTSHSPRSLTVALLAPDGAGKSTLQEGLRRSFPFPVHTTYMGVYQRGTFSSRLTSLRGIGFALRLCTLWGRYWVAAFQRARRRLVIFDRYTYDFLLEAQRQPSMAGRWRRWLLAHACPAPDLVIVLDAPGAVLFARKGEHSPEVLEERRQQYLDLRKQVEQVAVVDATRSADEVRRMVTLLIWDHYLQCRREYSARQTAEPVTTLPG